MTYINNYDGQTFKGACSPFAKTTPTDLVRSKLSTSEIQYRALTYLPDELLANIPEDENTYSLFQGFQATMPEGSLDSKRHRRRISRGRKLLEDDKSESETPPTIGKLKKEKKLLEPPIRDDGYSQEYG